jgi:cobalamin biosynthesis Mg chelatase CobN
MRTLSRLLSVAVLMAAATAAFAEQEMVILRDGISGMAEVVKTEPDSITVRFQTKDGASGETRLLASRVDPHNFFAIRHSHMEKTVENHIRLAVFCAENGMFNRAEAQVQAAKTLDPKKVEELGNTPEVMEKIATRLAEAAKRAYDNGDLKLCRELAEMIATRFTETSWADKATEALDLLDEAMQKQEAERAARKEKELEEAATAEAKAAAQARHGILRPIEARQEAGRRKNSQGLRARNRSTARRHFQAAAGDFEAALSSLASARRASTPGSTPATSTSGARASTTPARRPRTR